MSAPLLEINKLTMSLKDGKRSVEVLREVSLSIAPGEVVGLVGESGSGKSMTARTVMRLLPRHAHTSGEVILGGDDVLRLQGKALRQRRAHGVAMVFQDPRASVNPVRTCGSQLSEVLQVNGGLSRSAARVRAGELLETVGIKDRERVMRANPAQLSGGMLQRLMIAMALAADPQLLIADEATTALDVTIQAEIVGLLKDLCRSRDLALLFITHDLELAAVLCERIAVMYAGRIVEIDGAEAIFSRPAHPYTAALLKARPSLDTRVARLAAIPGRPPSPSEVPLGCAFAARCGYAQASCGEHHPSLRTLASGAQTACARVDEIAEQLAAHA